MLFDPALFERARCTDKEKEELVPVVRRMVGMSEKATKEGLLALEDSATKNEPFTAFGLHLVVSGLAPQALQDILCTLILSSDIRGKALLERMLVTDGFLGMQAGVNPTVLEWKLLAYLGDRVFFAAKDGAKPAK